MENDGRIVDSAGAYAPPDAATGGGMVSGLEGAPLYGLSVLAGVVLALWAKHVWPAWRDSMTSQSGQWRTESGFVKQLSAELDRALVRADEADTRAERAIERAEASDRRADKYFMELAEMKTQVKLLTYQLKVAHEKIDLLTARLNQVIGRDEELESTKRVISGHKP